MAEAVRVVVRCRPMNARERDLRCTCCVKMDGGTGQCSITNPADAKAPPKTFTFDGAYYTESTTEQIYADIGYPLVEGVCEGYNGTIFAYGQTGCGKSFSMQGITDPPSQRGIIPRAFDHIFETIHVSESSKYLVHASYLEIYNEEIRDLLGQNVKTKLELKEHPDKGIYVQGLSLHPCKNGADCVAVMERGWQSRSVGSTLMNAESSRSHSIFTIHMERCDSDEAGEEHIRAAKLNLVDLAGSERQAKTGASGDRFKEATKINLSLSALGNVISALVDGKSKHIPYRDSKLTRMLQDSLGGNTKTLMVACLSPADNNYDETLSTLRYANRAKNIKNKPKINEDPKDAMLREYQDEIRKLKAMLRGEIPVNMGDDGGSIKTLQPKVVEKVVHVTNSDAIEQEKARIKEEYEIEIENMKKEYHQMKMSKERLEIEIGSIQKNYNEKLATVEESQKGVSEMNGHTNHISNGERLLSISSTPVEDEDTSAHVYATRGQQAVHIASTAVHTYNNGEELAEDGTLAPRSSPTLLSAGNTGADQESLQQDARRRLQEIKQLMVGGEEANNQAVKERRMRKKKHVEERKRKLAEALSNMDGDDIMLEIYDNVQDELRDKTKALKRAREKGQAYQQEIDDLQSEFERERNDYLDTIRKNTKQIAYLSALVDKMHPCLRRDCNYASLERVRAQARYDEERELWDMPKMVVEKTRLPPTGVMPGGLQKSGKQINVIATAEDYETAMNEESRSEDRYREKLLNSNEQELANNYFRNTRTDRILKGTQMDRSRNLNPNNTSPSSSASLFSSTSPVFGRSASPGPHRQNGLGGGGGGSGGSSGSSDHLRAAAVHGHIATEEPPMRKPVRLEALEPLASKPRKRDRYL